MNLSEARDGLRDISECRSKFQHRVGKELRKMLPLTFIVEEFHIPGSRLHVDFLIPDLMLAVEADGGQHNNFSVFFHGTEDNFKRAQQCDSNKEEWCIINNFKLIRVSEGDNVKDLVRDALRR